MTRGPIAWVLAHDKRRLRTPIAFLLILGGLLSFLPVLGIWMLPLGIMLLAVDIPLLRPTVSAAMIRTRRRWAVWRHRDPAARRERRPSGALPEGRRRP